MSEIKPTPPPDESKKGAQAKERYFFDVVWPPESWEVVKILDVSFPQDKIYNKLRGQIEDLHQELLITSRGDGKPTKADRTRIDEKFHKVALEMQALHDKLDPEKRSEILNFIARFSRFLKTATELPSIPGDAKTDPEEKTAA